MAYEQDRPQIKKENKYRPPFGQSQPQERDQPQKPSRREEVDEDQDDPEQMEREQEEQIEDTDEQEEQEIEVERERRELPLEPIVPKQVGRPKGARNIDRSKQKITDIDDEFDIDKREKIQFRMSNPLFKAAVVMWLKENSFQVSMTSMELAEMIEKLK
jgi:hypothetical protein